MDNRQLAEELRHDLVNALLAVNGLAETVYTAERRLQETGDCNDGSQVNFVAEHERTLPRAIAIDFDGCLCANAYPEIGAPHWNIIAAAVEEQKRGTGIILWTCREGELLEAALDACSRWGLHFDAVNDSLPAWKEFYGNNTRKVGADEYWDDKAYRVENGKISKGQHEAKTWAQAPTPDEKGWCV